MSTNQSCGICFDDMTSHDLAYPILCPTIHCNFNMCSRCISHLVESSQSGYEMASDGNLHVKVKLQCPTCRGDFSSTIRDVLTLRLASEVRARFQDVPDFTLSGSELKLKYQYTSDVLARAQERLNQHNDGGSKEQKTKVVTNTKTNHNSSNMKNIKQESLSLFFPNTTIPIDKALFSGLESVMSLDEQLFVTKLLTSGNPNQLAQAAQILSEISAVVRRGYTMKDMTATASSLSLPSSTQETIRIRNHRTIQPSTPDSNSSNTLEDQAFQMSLSGPHLDAYRMSRKIEKHWRLHPLPTFMPYFVTMTADFNVYAKHHKVLKFQNEEWDGSVADAFASAMDMSNLPTNGSMEVVYDSDEQKSDEETNKQHDSSSEVTYKRRNQMNATVMEVIQPSIIADAELITSVYHSIKDDTVGHDHIIEPGTRQENYCHTELATEAIQTTNTLDSMEIGAIAQTHSENDKNKSNKEPRMEKIQPSIAIRTQQSNSVNHAIDDTIEHDATYNQVECNHAIDGLTEISEGKVTLSMDSACAKDGKNMDRRSGESSEENYMNPTDKLACNIFPTTVTTSHSINRIESKEGVLDACTRLISTSNGRIKRNRVIIRKARYKAAALGIREGMVVSHFNGEEFLGNAEELKQMIHKLYLSGNEYPTFTLVLNADLGTASALKLRAMSLGDD